MWVQLSFDKISQVGNFHFFVMTHQINIKDEKVILCFSKHP